MEILTYVRMTPTPHLHATMTPTPPGRETPSLPRVFPPTKEILTYVRMTPDTTTPRQDDTHTSTA